MKVGTEITFCTLTTHSPHSLSVDNKRTDVGAFGLCNELLNENVHFYIEECLNHRFSGVARFSENNSDALRSFKQFDHHRRSAHLVQQVVDIFWTRGKRSFRHTYSCFCEQLQTAEF